MNQTDSTKFTRKRVVQIDPLAVTESLGFQTFRKGARKPWTKEEDIELAKIIQLELNNNNDIDSIDWEKISDLVSPDGTRKSKDCRKRWSNSLDPSLRKGKWTSEEDDLLVKAFEKFGTSWLKVAQEIEGRTDDQCAKRYMEVLDPRTKDRLKPWTQEEDLLLIKQVKLYGTKWRTVCSAFESRPSLTCRNRWRKLVTEVVRGKADPIIKKEVENVTNGNSAEVLENLSRQQEELSKSYDEPEFKRKLKRRKIDTNTGSKTEMEWFYQLNSKSNDGERDPSNSKVGSIKDQESVQYLVDYAKTNDLSIVIHQHVHHHYSSNNERNSSTPGSVVEPEDQMSRFQHFNYLPPMTQVPKLNSSSSPNVFADATTTQHHHHHHHHHHHQESSSSPEKVLIQSSEEAAKGESDLLKLLNTDERNERDISPDSNPLTPLTQAVELVTAAENSKYNNNKHKSRQTNNFAMAHSQSHEDEEDEEGLDFWETMRNLTEVPSHQQTKTQHQNESRKSINQGYKQNQNQANTQHRYNRQIQQQQQQQRQQQQHQQQQQSQLPQHQHLNQFAGQVNHHQYQNQLENNHQRQNQTQNQNQNQSQNQYANQSRTQQQNFNQSKDRPVSQHHPLHYQSSFTRESTPKRTQPVHSIQIDEDLDEEDKNLAREIDESGLDHELLNSYGLFYNVYTKEGSTFPDVQQNQQQQLQEQNYQRNESIYDQWGSEYIIPFNPS
ncbi:BAS1 [Candida jiufengensis]|uniref:BAS1 n=1 Tax=Candida jiufengensis TaxID=497108 RepID=UPI002224D2AF|nr:BAS1 [Candida jiufengensis]KAI5955043.1 BAS1 [Candida jiufengensis]